jgi:hypothetical protein
MRADVEIKKRIDNPWSLYTNHNRLEFFYRFCLRVSVILLK